VQFSFLSITFDQMIIESTFGGGPSGGARFTSCTEASISNLIGISNLNCNISDGKPTLLL